MFLSVRIALRVYHSIALGARSDAFLFGTQNEAADPALIDLGVELLESSTDPSTAVALLRIAGPLSKVGTIRIELSSALIAVHTLTANPKPRRRLLERRIQQIEAISTIAHFAENHARFIAGDLTRNLADLAVGTPPSHGGMNTHAVNRRSNAKGMKGFSAVHAKEHGVRGSTTTARETAVHPATEERVCRLNIRLNEWHT